MRSVNDSKTKLAISNIRKVRELKSYSQDYLAAKLGISQNAYSKIELGYSNITLSRLLNIAEILEVDIVDLLSSDIDNVVQLRLVE